MEIGKIYKCSSYGSVRSVNYDGKVWFLESDIFMLMGTSSGSMTHFNRRCLKELKDYTKVNLPTNGKIRKRSILSKDGAMKIMREASKRNMYTKGLLAAFENEVIPVVLKDERLLQGKEADETKVKESTLFDVLENSPKSESFKSFAKEALADVKEAVAEEKARQQIKAVASTLSDIRSTELSMELALKSIEIVTDVLARMVEESKAKQAAADSQTSFFGRIKKFFASK